MIAVEPLGGLCNRMRTLDAALALASALQRELHVIWPLRANLNCRFDSIFNVPPQFKTLRQFKDPRWQRWARTAISKRKYARFYDADEVNYLLSQGVSFNSIADYSSVAIRTAERFFSVRRNFIDFVPVDAIQSKIDSYKLEVGKMVGVHIRRADHKLSIAKSPTSKFIACMRRELEIRDDTMFFLATDSTEEENILRREFPGRIVVHPKASVSRKKPNAIADAVIDLYCLANCRKIIGSYQSSFSETAAEIKNIELQLAT